MKPHFLDKIPTVCGGMGPNGEVYSDCLKYDAMTDSWSKSGDLSTGRSSPGVAYNLVFGLVMAGGWNRTKYLQTVEYTRNGIATGNGQSKKQSLARPRYE